MYQDYATTDWLRYLAIGLACLFLLAMVGSVSAGSSSDELSSDPPEPVSERSTPAPSSPELPEIDPASLPDR